MYLPYCIAQNHNYGSRQHVLHAKKKKIKQTPQEPRNIKVSRN